MTAPILGRNVPEAYLEGLNALRIFGEEEPSRLGTVRTIPGITHLQIEHPDERILFDPIRKANPYFHLMEFVWMMAGSDDAKWISYYNSNMMQYSDSGVIHGAYGHRWRRSFGLDQISEVIDRLRADPSTRRAVLTMWDPSLDLASTSLHDYPCNTQIIFRVRNRYLTMYVFNRSNDFIWGMLGANAVHMTMLFELIAHATGFQMGTYNVISVNTHIYKNLENYERILETIDTPNPYFDGLVPTPLFKQGELYEAFIDDAERAVKTSMGFYSEFQTWFFRNVVKPMHFAYKDRKESVGTGGAFLNEMKAKDWEMACREWEEWKVALPRD